MFLGLGFSWLFEAYWLQGKLYIGLGSYGLVSFVCRDGLLLNDMHLLTDRAVNAEKYLVRSSEIRTK